MLNKKKLTSKIERSRPKTTVFYFIDPNFSYGKYYGFISSFFTEKLSNQNFSYALTVASCLVFLYLVKHTFFRIVKSQ